MTMATNAATTAAEEAVSGAWLKELQSRHLPRVLAPGMPHGIFGPWQDEGIPLTSLLKPPTNDFLASCTLAPLENTFEGFSGKFESL